MKWEKKHDIILSWIDSCTTFEQLESLTPFVKSLTFDNSSLLFMIRMKATQIMTCVYVDSIKKLASPFVT